MELSAPDLPFLIFSLAFANQAFALATLARHKRPVAFGSSS